jgi:hypothetical protein
MWDHHCLKLEVVDQFMYVGSSFNNKLSLDYIRMGKAKTAMNRLKKKDLEKQKTESK